MASRPLSRSERKRRYVERVYARLLAPARLERQAATETLKVIRTMGAEIQRRLRSGRYADRPWEIQIQRELSGEVSNVMADARRQLDLALRPIEERMATTAVQTAIRPLKDVGYRIKTVQVNRRQVELMSATRADLVQKIFEPQRRKIDLEIQKVGMGIQTPYEAQLAIKPIVIERMSRVPGTFGPRARYGGSVLYQTERIVRTEVNRIYSVQNFDTIRDIRNEVPGVMKKWIAALDTRTRDSHIEVNEEVVGPDDHFSNGLLFPHDPAGPAEETINCRCRTIPWLESFAIPQAPSILAGIAYLRESARCYRMISCGAIA